MNGPARVADALQCAILDPGGLPAAQSADIELSIGLTKAPAHHAGGKAERETVDAPLDDAVHFFGHDVKQRGSAVAQVEHVVVRQSPARAGDPNLAAAGVVHI